MDSVGILTMMLRIVTELCIFVHGAVTVTISVVILTVFLSVGTLVLNFSVGTASLSENIDVIWPYTSFTKCQTRSYLPGVKDNWFITIHLKIMTL